MSEDSTIKDAQLKLTALKSEAKILARQIEQRIEVRANQEEVRANQANDVFEKWNTYEEVEVNGETAYERLIDNFMSHVEDNDIDPFEAKKMLQEDIELLGDSQSELKQQLQDMFNEIDRSWV